MMHLLEDTSLSSRRKSQTRPVFMIDGVLCPLLGLGRSYKNMQKKKKVGSNEVWELEKLLCTQIMNIFSLKLKH